MTRNNKRGRIHARIDSAVHLRAKHRAIDERVDLQDVVNDFLAAWAFGLIERPDVPDSTLDNRTPNPDH